MPGGLFKALRGGRERSGPVFRPAVDLKATYDVIVIGGGGHGLAAAYHLASDHHAGAVAVLDQGALAGPGVPLESTFLSTDHASPEVVRLYKAAMDQFRDLGRRLDSAVPVASRGHLRVARSGRGRSALRWRADLGRHLAIETELLGPEDAIRICPALAGDRDGEDGELAALHHPHGRVFRPDALIWAYARAAAHSGVEVHRRTRVLEILSEGGRATGVKTDRGTAQCGRILLAVETGTVALAESAGLSLPVRSHTIEGCVSAAQRGGLVVVVEGEDTPVAAWQTEAGALALVADDGLAAPPSKWPSADAETRLAGRSLDLFPSFGAAQVTRLWDSVVDATPDGAPIICETEVRDLVVGAGWGWRSAATAPVCGPGLAELVAEGRAPDLLAPFDAGRFARFDLFVQAAMP